MKKVLKDDDDNDKDGPGNHRNGPKNDDSPGNDDNGPNTDKEEKPK